MPEEHDDRGVVLSKTHRVNMRMYEADYNKLTYWSDAFGMGRTELLLEAMRHYIAHRNKDYDLPAAEIQRLNQMVDAVNNLATNQALLQQTLVNGLDALLGIARGDNYLSDKEDGSL